MVRRFVAALFAAATVIGIVATPGIAVAKQDSSNNKGPIGWDIYRRLDELPALTSGVATKQFSSFDRTGGNGDFSHCLTTTSDGCVIAQHSGAGEVDSIWFTRDGGDTTNTGNITIQLDGKTVLHAPLVDVVNGKLGAPFVFPLVANADQSSGGDTILVPMAFRSSMKIITDTDPVYYHVTYRTFADSSGVKTFDPSDKALDVIAKLKAAGAQDPKPAAPNAKTQQHNVDLASGRSSTIGTEHGPGAISQIKLHLPQLSVIPPRRVSDDGRAFGTNGSDEFTVAINPDNQGVRLTRRFDPGIGNQKASISVDGMAVAGWQPEPAKSGGQWLDESVDLPASATAGKSKITIRDTFVSSDNDFNAFTYWADSLAGGQPTRTDTVDVGPNHTADETAHDYHIVAQTWSGQQTYVYPPGDNAAVQASDAILSATRLRVTVDGQRTVDAPIGQFFGSGLGGYQVNALMTSVDPTNKNLTAWWPMPYIAGATVQLVNESGVAIKGATASITATADSQWAKRLMPGGGYGYFRATSNSADTTPGADYEFLQAQGQGKFVGVSHTMSGATYRGYLEGDERVYVDGANTPQIHGTGTEDFYEGGWYFNRDVFSDPFNGESGHEPPGTGGCPTDKDCTSTYRDMIADAVPFKTGITFGIEHGGVDDEQAHYASTAFWYGSSGDALRWTDTVSQSGTPLTSTFEGNNGAPAPVTYPVSSTTSPVSFRIKVDPTNHGVVLRRISDQQNAYQQAEVSVNGHDAGSWLEPLGNSTHRWLDDDYQLPSALTTGHSTLNITITPAPGAPAWTAASYAALSVVAPFRDRTAPGAVSGLAAAGGTVPSGSAPQAPLRTLNSITLSWKPATDNVYAPGYQVYGSTSATGPFSKIADTPQTAFAHSGLGLKQTWYYRVRAVDAAGNTGPWSATASATSGNVERVEAESLLPPVDADAPVQSQGNCCNVQWSGGAQLWFQPTSAGKHVTVAFDVPTTGTYDVTAVQTKARDYGINTIAIDGTVTGPTLDAYNNPDVVVTPPIDYGTQHLSAGKHTLTLTVTGKNADSIGYLAGLDYVDLTLNG